MHSHLLHANHQEIYSRRPALQEGSPDFFHPVFVSCDYNSEDNSRQHFSSLSLLHQNEPGAVLSISRNIGAPTSENDDHAFRHLKAPSYLYRTRGQHASKTNRRWIHEEFETELYLAPIQKQLVRPSVASSFSRNDARGETVRHFYLPFVDFALLDRFVCNRHVLVHARNFV